MTQLTYEDYKARLNIQDVLVDAGYTLNRRDGLRYPSYVRLDSNGRRIRNDKFIVSGGGQCCFQPPVIKNYNIISFIKEHPEKFADYTPGMDKDRLVNLVCCRLLNVPVEERNSRTVASLPPQEPFRIEEYNLHQFKGDDRESQKPFFPYFHPRALDLSTQYAFRHAFVLAARETRSGKTLRNLAFPMTIPGNPEKVVGFEERGRRGKDGKAYKGMARGSNASEGLWTTSPEHTDLKDAKRVFVFESAYDAMAFFQILAGKDSNLMPKEKKELRNAVYVSTGGNPSARQLEGLMRTAKDATFHLGFDMDEAGIRFAEQFKALAEREKIPKNRIIREEPSPGIKDFNDELIEMAKKKEHPLYPNNVPDSMKAYVDSFRKDTDLPAIKDVLHPSVFNDERISLLPDPLRNLFGKYVSAKEEATELCASRLVHPDEKGEAVKLCNETYTAFKEEMCKILNITSEHIAEENSRFARMAEMMDKQESQKAEHQEAQDDDLEDREDKKIQHDVDYTTSMDEQGNMEMEEEVNDQEEKRHFKR